MLALMIVRFVLAEVQQGSSELGTNFSDYFSKLNTELWTVEESDLSCLGSAEDCVYVTSRNVHFVHSGQSSRKNENQKSPTKAVVVLENNCNKDSECCTKNDNGEDVCTTWTSGQILSKHKYRYGSFRILARLADLREHTTMNATSDVFCCISLESTDVTDVQDYISLMFCISALTPSKAHLLWQVKGYADSKVVHLSPVRRHGALIDVGRSISMYKITRHKTGMEWYVNGELVAAVYTKSGVVVPDDPLRIKFFILPEAIGGFYPDASLDLDEIPDDKLLDALDKLLDAKWPPRLQYKMHIYGVDFKTIENVLVHNELFELPDSASTIGLCSIFLFVAVIALCMALSELSKRFKQSSSTTVNGDYFRLQEDSKRNHVWSFINQKI